MKIRSGFRRLMSEDGDICQYKIGEYCVVIFYEDDTKVVINHDQLLGMNWSDIERYRCKNKGSDHAANITPKTIAKFLGWKVKYPKIDKQIKLMIKESDASRLRRMLNAFNFNIETSKDEKNQKLANSLIKQLENYDKTHRMQTPTSL